MGPFLGRGRPPWIAYTAGALDVLIEPLDPGAARPLHRQLYDHIRSAILAGRVRPGARLPSTRELRASLGVSRNTVLTAFEQLLAEGFLVAQVGSGTYVAAAMPEAPVAPQVPDVATPGRPVEPLSHRGEGLVNAAAQRPRRFLAPGMRAQVPPFAPWFPAVDELDFGVFGRIAARYYRQPPKGLLNYSDSGGYGPLREAIAGHLSATRAVNTRADQVVIFSGSQHAMDSIIRVVLDAGDLAAVEDPGYPGVRASLLSLGAKPRYIPVDGEGIIVPDLENLAPSARLVHVTPSHQFPMGPTMSLRRRLALLKLAAESGMWVIEDDYDSEFRYSGQPLASLQGLDHAGRVIYIGTFSKVLFPGLRIGYAVLPPELVGPVKDVRWMSDEHPPGITQAVVADFIAEGHFARHLRKMRRLYGERQRYFIDATTAHWGDMLRVDPSDCGMHLIGWLGHGLDELDVAERLGAAGIEVIPLSEFSGERPIPPGLLLGFVPWRPAEVDRAIEAARAILEEARIRGAGRAPGSA